MVNKRLLDELNDLREQFDLLQVESEHKDLQIRELNILRDSTHLKNRELAFEIDDSHDIDDSRDMSPMKHLAQDNSMCMLEDNDDFKRSPVTVAQDLLPQLQTSQPSTDLLSELKLHNSDFFNTSPQDKSAEISNDKSIGVDTSNAEKKVLK